MTINASQGYSTSANSAQSSSYSQTYGTAATTAAQANAAAANNSALAAWQKAAEYNAAQAKIQRDWEEKMANSVYQRTVKDMTAAGINPILAAQMGLGTASVGSGATASMSNPQSFMSNTFADQNSASQSSSSGWSNSENGLMTFFESLGNAATTIANAIASSKAASNATQAMKTVAEKGNILKQMENAANGRDSWIPTWLKKIVTNS